jgi:DNA-directed RNA polymerase subunit L
LRIQTKGDLSAVDALKKGLDDVISLASHILDEFESKVEEGDYVKD